ncbi:hypothetical protein DFH06DRAFT_422434 [Mycena polygramma]|nr:hypothetical protein DFH06DRAFT_422434 [Mycena polygramma]
MPSPPPSQGASQSSPLTPSKRPASSVDHELSPVHKRLNTSRDAPTPSPRSAASKARLAAMLSAQGQPAQPEASTSTLPSSSLPNSNVSPSPASSYHTALSETSHSPLLPSWCPAKPTSAKSTSPLFTPVTPPPTAEHTERHSPNSALEVQSPDVHRTRNDQSVSNGMRSSVLGASKGARLDDPFSPSGSYTSSGGSEPRGPVASHSRASADVEDLADRYMDFSVQIHSYMKMLEERIDTAEKSNDDKAEKIECLQEEIERVGEHARQPNLKKRRKNYAYSACTICSPALYPPSILNVPRCLVAFSVFSTATPLF